MDAQLNLTSGGKDELIDALLVTRDSIAARHAPIKDKEANGYLCIPLRLRTAIN